MTDDLLAQFIVEGRELAETASRGLLALERAPGDRAALDEVFRAFHTLKGSTGLFDLPQLGRLLHAAEERLEALRSGGVADAELVTYLLRTIGETERWLDALEAGGEPSDALRSAATRLEAELREDEGEAADNTSMAARGDAAWAQGLRDLAGRLEARTAIRYAPATDAYFRGDDPLAALRAAPDVIWLGLEAAPGLAAGADYAPYECALVFLALSKAAPEALRESFRLVADEVEIVPLEAQAKAQRVRTLRVAAEQVDAVAVLVDELVIAKNALAHEFATARDARRLALRQLALDRAVASLHGAVANLRLAPLAPVLNRLPVQVRELGAVLGKDVRLELSGDAPAVDKAIVDGLFEPLLHVVRNAVDHGVEASAERLAAGKPPAATLRLAAFTQGDEAVIEVRDDGRGIDAARVRELAVQRSLLDQGAAQALSDQAAVDLVFAPGFSTAGAVTEISGRGVGLDAVRTAIGRLGGRVGLETATGQGTTIRISVPLRAVLTKVAVAHAGGERFGVPVAAIREVVRLQPGDVTPIRSGRAFVHRETVIPIVTLADLLGLDSSAADLSTALIVGQGEARVAIGVRGLGEQIEAPLRPMSGLLAGVPGVQGSLVEGDGRVLMVLDVAELAS